MSSSGNLPDPNNGTPYSDGGMPSGPIRVARIRTEYRTNPVGIDVKQPRFDWWLASDLRGQKQTAYQILVATSEPYGILA